VVEVHGRIGAETVPGDEGARENDGLRVDPEKIRKIGHLFENVRSRRNHHSPGPSSDEGTEALDEIHGHLYGIVTTGLAAPFHYFEGRISGKGRNGFGDAFRRRCPGFFRILLLSSPRRIAVASGPYKDDFASFGCHCKHLLE
jgi:hypothetical protein